MPSRTGEGLKRWLAQVPGCLEAALTVKHALMPPPAGAQPGEVFLGGLRALDRIRPAAPGDERRVLFFACRESWLRLSLMTTVGLLARNCRVDFAYLPYRRVRSDDSLVDSKEMRFYYGRFLTGNRHPRLRFFDLTRVSPAPVSELMEEEARSQGLLDTRWVLAREEVDIEANPDHQAVYEFRRRRDFDTMRRFTSVLTDNLYDVVLIPHGNLRELGAAYRAARLLGRRIVSFDFKDRSEAVVLSDSGPVSEMNTSSEWTADAPHVLSAGARGRLEELLASRRGTEWKGFTWAAQRSPYGGGAPGLIGNRRPGERVALMCPNVSWDSALLGRDRPFPSLAEWVRQTVRYFAGRTGCRLIVRVHPAEVIFGTAQPVSGIIRQCCPSLPEHIQVVGPEDPVNTYDLMEACDFGLVYNTTAGLEMAMHGIPAIVAGRPHYVEKGFTIDVNTAQEYRSAIESLIADPRRLSERQTELAWCYADVFFFRWHKPFPWCTRNFAEHLARWPMDQVLRGDAWELFGPTFDQMAGRV